MDNDTKLFKGSTNSGVMMGQGDIAFVTCPRCRIIKIHPAVSVCTMHRWVKISQNQSKPPFYKLFKDLPASQHEIDIRLDQ